LVRPGRRRRSGRHVCARQPERPDRRHRHLVVGARLHRRPCPGAGGEVHRPAATGSGTSASGDRRPMTEALTVGERGRTITFTFDDMMRYHGVHSPAGVAMAFKVMQRAFAALSPEGPPPRRAVLVRTAFRGPVARDGFEAGTRAATDGRYTGDRSLGRSDLGGL